MEKSTESNSAGMKVKNKVSHEEEPTNKDEDVEGGVSNSKKEDVSTTFERDSECWDAKSNEFIRHLVNNNFNVNKIIFFIFA